MGEVRERRGEGTLPPGWRSRRGAEEEELESRRERRQIRGEEEMTSPDPEDTTSELLVEEPKKGPR